MSWRRSTWTTILLEASREARVLAGQRELDIELRRLEPLRARGNADRIKQLLLNLLDNAIKFTPDGGRITLGLYRDGHEAVLEVVDSGIGIAPEDRQRIFNRFWQADPSRRRAQQSGQDAGLGLSIVKWIVDAHHGSIDLVSEPGAGTTFRVRLPLTQETPALPPQTEPARGVRLRQAWLRMRRNGEVAPQQLGDGS